MKKVLAGLSVFAFLAVFAYAISFAIPTKMDVAVGDLKITGWNHMMHATSAGFKKLATDGCKHCHKEATGKKDNVQDTYKGPAYAGCLGACHDAAKVKELATAKGLVK